MEWFLLKWNRKYRKARDTGCVPRNELIALQMRNSCDEREMIISSSRRIALLVPATNVTMGARFGICWCSFALIAGFFKARFDMAEVGRVVGDSVSLFCEVDRGRHNVHELGRQTLDGS